MRIAGIDIGATTIKTGVLLPDGTLEAGETLPTPIGQPEKLADMVAAAVLKMDAALLGVGSAGAVVLGNYVTSNNLDWVNVPLGDLLRERLPLPLWLDNDAQAALMAEWHDGACRGMRDVVYLTLGTGVGGAAILDGRPWRGRDNTGAEFGHMITHADGLPCSCGGAGCFELYASASALSRMGGGKSTREVIAGAKAGDKAMTRAFEEYLHELAVGIRSINEIFVPDCFVLGGGLSAAGEALLKGVQRHVAALYTLHPQAFRADIRLAKHQNDAGVIGAAALAKFNLLQ